MRRGTRPAPRGPLVLALALALALLTLDALSPRALDPARTAVGAVLGPVQVVGHRVVSPIVSLGSALRTNGSLRHDVATLQARNSALESQMRTTGLDRARLAAYDGLTRAARDTGYALVPAHVIGYGPAANFSRTVTVDAGRSAGLRPDATVISSEGLVGRVLSVGTSTSTVLLLCDADSVVGARLASSMKVGFLRGRGDLGDRARLALSLVDTAATPARGDIVVSWGSERGGPYVAGIPIGTVESVRISARDTTKEAVIRPLVSFGSLDLVGVVVPKGTRSDRTLISPSGASR